MDKSTDNAQINFAGLGEIKIPEHPATEAFRNFTLLPLISSNCNWRQQ